jgi:hypothetical protein
MGHAESYETVFARGSSVHQKCSNYALTNLLFGLCKSMWIIDSLITHFSLHFEALTCPFTPEALHVSTPYPSNVFTLDAHLNLSKSLGMHLLISLQLSTEQSSSLRLMLSVWHCLIFTHYTFVHFIQWWQYSSTLNIISLYFGFHPWNLTDCKI